ncbi:MAG: hypothetical protein HY986_24345 [Candidatus Melainabacteria bacterium]|nr:hypothetical protein [Candidatus Melainabacteria bacterium]
MSQGELTGKETEKRDKREVGVDTGHGLSGVSYTASGINDALSMAIGHVRLGDLLKASGIISYEFLKEALSSFEEKGLPLGKVLTLSGFLTASELAVALEIQTLINNRQLPFDVGVRVLAISHDEKVPLSEAFSRASVVQPEDLLSNKLGQLLSQSRLITNEDLDQALSVSQRTGLPLGHIFCYRNLLSQQLLDTALLGQQLVRRGSLSRENCLQALSAAREREVALLSLPVNAAYKPSMRRGTSRLGELFFSAGILDDMSLISALQLSLSRGIPCGEAISEVQGTSTAVIEQAVSMQEMLDNETLTLEQVKDVFIGLFHQERSFEHALAEASVANCSGNPARLMVQLLKDAQLLVVPADPAAATPALAPVLSELSACLDVNYNQGGIVGRLLISAGLVSDSAAWAALRLTHLLTLEVVPYERALAALEAANLHGSVDEVLIGFGALNRTRLKWR